MTDAPRKRGVVFLAGADADTLMRQALPRMRRAYGPEHTDVVWATAGLREDRDGALVMDQRRWAEAEPFALRVLAIRDSLADSLAGKAAAQLAALYEGWGKPARAAEYRGRASR